MGDGLAVGKQDERRAAVLQRVEAERPGHNFVGPEHLMLGVLAEGTGAGPGILTRLGVDLVAFRLALAAAAVPASDGETTPFGKLSVETRQVLSNAHEEALRLHHQYIGQEHFLLASQRTGGPWRSG